MTRPVCATAGLRGRRGSGPLGAGSTSAVSAAGRRRASAMPAARGHRGTIFPAVAAGSNGYRRPLSAPPLVQRSCPRGARTKSYAFLMGPSLRFALANMHDPEPDPYRLAATRTRHRPSRLVDGDIAILALLLSPAFLAVVVRTIARGATFGAGPTVCGALLALTVAIAVSAPRSAH
jgi:hypothetical protein